MGLQDNLIRDVTDAYLPDIDSPGQPCVGWKRERVPPSNPLEKVVDLGADDIGGVPAGCVYDPSAPV